MSSTAEEVLRKHGVYSEQTETVLKEVSELDRKNSGERSNQAITLQYRGYATDPYAAAWFAPATLASKKVGVAIQATDAVLENKKIY